MYNPKDSYIQNQIYAAIRILKAALDESTDKLQTTEDICNVLNKEFAIEAEPKV